jgi:hypothetical protein
MTEHEDPVGVATWSNNLDELDIEIARLALLCRVRLLDPGVVERVLHNDAGVCGTDNPVGFAKLHSMLMMHFVMVKKTLDAVGTAQTEQIVLHIAEALKKRFGDVLGEWPADASAADDVKP